MVWSVGVEVRMGNVSQESAYKLSFWRWTFGLDLISLHATWDVYGSLVHSVHILFFFFFVVYPGGSTVKNLPAIQETQEELWARFLGSWESLGEGNGNPLQYSCLENPMDNPWVQKRVWHDLATKQQGLTSLGTDTCVHGPTSSLWLQDERSVPTSLILFLTIVIR